MLTENYRRHLAASVLVLVELRHSHAMTGVALREQIRMRCRTAPEHEPTFDFVGWCGTTFWDFLDVLASSQFLRAIGTKPRTTTEWSEAEILLTQGGLDFVDEVRAQVADLLAFFSNEDIGATARSVA